MKSHFLILGIAALADAHTLFTTLFINNKNQGDGTCVRMPHDDATATGPIYPITGEDMACGRNGGDAVAFVCPSPSKATLTFEFRDWPDAQQPGVIDAGHKGPCAVYVKRVDDMFSDPAAGTGWFKIWEDGYDSDSGEWCVDKLIANEGLLSVDLPAGLPSGYYLVRPEILALHYARKGDPQFYTGCAQIFIQDGGSGALDISDEYMTSIPGYVDGDTPGLKFDIYQDHLPSYPMPGPKVYTPPDNSTESSVKQLNPVQKLGTIPDNCAIKNANWCARPIGKYSGQDACWKGVKDCYAQSKKCWSSAPPSGSRNCYTWSDYCKLMDKKCDSGEFEGPPEFDGKEKYADVPGAIPTPFDDAVKEKGILTTPVGDGGLSSAADSGSISMPTSGAEQEKSDGGGERGHGGLKISPDGSCGGSTGQTCQGSSFGACCSGSGECGRKARHCKCECQAGFGECWN